MRSGVRHDGRMDDRERETLLKCKLVGRPKLISYVDVIANTDDVEGRGAPVIIGTFMQHEHGAIYAVGRGPSASDAQVKAGSGIAVELENDRGISRVFLLGREVLRSQNAEALETLRAKALSKLTDAERFALLGK